MCCFKIGTSKVEKCFKPISDEQPNLFFIVAPVSQIQGLTHVQHWSAKLGGHYLHVHVPPCKMLNLH